MTVGLKWAGKVREILAEARPLPSVETKAQAAFQLFEFNSELPPLVQTHQARAAREITRIACWYQGLKVEVDRALDVAGVATLAGLDDDTLDQLLARMKLLEDNIQNGGDSPDAPAAR